MLPASPIEPAFVLVGENNPGHRLAMQALLERFGVRAHFVNDGKLVLEAVTARRYRLVLLDLMMPKLTGFEVTRAIRRLEYGSGWHTPIVAVTAVDPELSREACIEAGMDDFIAKPIDILLLQELLGRWLPASLSNILLPGKGPAGGAAPEGQRSPEPDSPAAMLELFLNVTGALLERLKAPLPPQDAAAAEDLAQGLDMASLSASTAEMVQLSRHLGRDIRSANWPAALATYRELTEAHKRTTEGLEAPLKAALARKGARARV